MGKRWKNAEEFKGAVDKWAEKVGVKVKEVHLRPMETKWASYSVKAGRMTFDTGLLEIDREFGEYVLLHEVLHIKIPNHGKLFKSFLFTLMPDWQNRMRRFGKIDDKMGPTG
jgi:predicted metal-dependent hydrolase